MNEAPKGNDPLWDSYADTFNAIRGYWAAYGGWRALLRSPYFLGAAVITGTTIPWGISQPWWDRILAILPNVLGFSLAGFGMLLAVGGDRHQVRLARATVDGKSVLLKVSAVYLHFIFVQCAALLWAWFYEGARPCAKFVLVGTAEYLAANPDHFLTAAKAFATAVGMFLGYYSIFCAFAAALRAFSQVDIFVGVARKQPRPPSQ